jgi:hypothetical protein
LEEMRALIPWLVGPVLVSGGAWPMARGQGKAAVSVAYLQAESVSGPEGNRHAYGISEWGVSTHGETGLSPGLALGWNWNLLKGVHSDSLDGVAITDPELSLSLHLGKAGSFMFAAQVMAVFPWGPANPPEAPAYLYALFSQRVWAFELRPLLGWSRGKAWFQGGASPRWRSDDFAAQFRYHLAGGTGTGKWNFMLAWSGVFPLDNRPVGLPGDQEQYFGAQLAVDHSVARTCWLGGQVDGMINAGQEMPLAGRGNVYLRFAW